MNPSIKKIISLLALSFVSGMIGVAGLMLIENYTFIEAFYMTVITLSTVGFETRHKFSDAGMIFMAIYIMLNIGLFAYIVSTIIRFVFEGELTGEYMMYKNKKALKHMDNHIIVCGFGRNGSKAFNELHDSNEKAVIIDRDDQHQHSLQKNGHVFIQGDAADERLLMRAGIDRAKAIIITLPNDAENVFITLSARELNPSVRIIARASQEASFGKLLKAGANDVVMPDNLGGKHMAQLVTKPSVIHFLNMLEGVSSDFLMEEVTYKQLKSEHRGKSIMDMNIRNVSGASVVAHERANGEFVVNPKADSVLKDGGAFILLGTSEDMDAFKQVFVD